MKQFISLIIFTLCCIHSFAQDSVAYQSSKLHFSKTQLIAPASLIASGLLLCGPIKNDIVQWRNTHLADFHTSIDDGLALAPIAVVYVLDLAGLPAKNDFLNRSAILVKGELMILGSVYLLKNVTKVSRPDGSDIHSFPSSHTAQAFLAATFLSEEYKDRIRWMPYAAYGLAGSVAVLRMANNRHYISDVLVGAGMGILSQKVAFWTHQYRWGKSKKEKRYQF